MYGFIRNLFGAILRIFYRRRSLGGAVPKQGPIILVANHPNGLVDPVAVMSATPRVVRFLAKEPLFRMPVIGWLVKGAQALPVYRAQDGASGRSNKTTFAAVIGALQEGACICLFPEGESHDDPQLRPLKSGTARIALQAESRSDFALGLRIVPVGLNYVDKTRFASEMALLIGEPIKVAEFREQHAESERHAAKALTSAIDQAMRTVTINLTDREDRPLLELAGRIWTGAADEDPAVRLRMLADAQRTFAPTRIDELRHRLRDFRGELHRLGVSPEQLAETPRRRFLPQLLRVVVNLTLVLPAVLIGALAYAVPYLIVRTVIGKRAPTPDVVATEKVLLSMLAFPIWHGILIWLLARYAGGTWALAGAVLLPCAALVARHWLAGRTTIMRDLRLLLRLPSRSALGRALRDERDAIRAQIDALAHEYKPLAE